MPNKVEKMYIQAYSKADYTEASKVGDKFLVQVNPESYKVNYTLEFADAQAPGTSAINLRFKKIPPQQISFDFLFDNTGVIQDASLLSIAVSNPFSGGGSKTVIDQLESFKQTVLNYQGNIHRPNFLKLHWGTLTFKGVLTSMDIDFKLFNPDGTPIRAMVKVNLKGSIEDAMRTALEDKQSPDITHERVFKANDRFTLMAEKIYNNGGYYIDAARFNGLTGFRKIPQGTHLYFPPLS